MNDQEFFGMFGESCTIDGFKNYIMVFCETHYSASSNGSFIKFFLARIFEHYYPVTNSGV